MLIKISPLILLLSCFNFSLKADHFLSFIVPCYNCGGTIRETLDSIYLQNLTIPFEIICTDDGSQDNTRDILFKYQANNDNLHVYVHKNNQGGAAARNTCVLHSKGDLIFCLDSDNVLVSNSVNKLINLLDEFQCDGAAFKEIRYFNGNFNHQSSWFYEAPNNLVDAKHILSTFVTPGASGNYLYTKKSYIKARGYPIYAGALDTYGFAFRQHATGTIIAILPNSFYWHRTSPNSYWVQFTKKNNINPILFKILTEFPELYEKKTYEYLISCNPNTHNFVADIDDKRLKIKN